MDINKKIDQILITVDKPARYAGGEFGLPKFDKKNPIKACMIFPDIYEIGMSNLGIRILYDVLNKKPRVECERCFAPWTDMGEKLKKENIELFSIERRTPLKEFDFLGFSMQYELLYSNLIYILDLANIPYYAKDRDDSFPIIIAGGPCTANPEPFADFFDLICIGEGEEVISQIADIILEKRGDKKSIIEKCSNIKGVYAPSIHTIRKNGEKLVTKAVVQDFNNISFPENPIVPNLGVVHDRPVLELFRGCYSNCRFCQASFFYRPIRVKSSDILKKQAEELIKSTGCEELSLSSLSTGDYPFLTELLNDIIPIVDKNKVKLQLPSLRLDSFTEELMSNTRMTGSLTFAPEAGTQRLRDVINKNITEEDIEKTLRLAFKKGYRNVKLYFMIGLPTETDEDLLGIVDIVKRAKMAYFEETNRRDVNVSVSTSVFVPKPLTPFQWAPQISREEMKRKHIFLRDELGKQRGVRFSWSDERVSYLEAIFARGDKRLSEVIVKAYEEGAVFDSWTEKFAFYLWEKALRDCGINALEYTREYGLEEILPWSFIDFGVSDNYLKSEYKKAYLGESSKGCKIECYGCGASKLAKCYTPGK